METPEQKAARDEVREAIERIITPMDAKIYALTNRVKKLEAQVKSLRANSYDNFGPPE